MTRPTKLVILTRACGHSEEVRITDDGRDAVRIARKQRKRCTACAIALNKVRVAKAVAERT